MPSDHPWTDADLELVAAAIYAPLPGDPTPRPEFNRTGARLWRKAEAVLDALTAAGWRPARDFLPAAVEALDRHAARVREQEWERVAAEIDDEATRWPGESRDFHAGLRRAAAVVRHMAARIDTTPEAGAAPDTSDRAEGTTA